MKGKRAFSVLGNIAIVNFSDGTNEKEKKEFAREILGKNKSIRTVLEKSGRFSGELRVQKTKHLLGEKTKEVLYKENGCEFRFNIDKVYFSSRLANERKEVCSFVKPKDKVLAMFSGVSPFPIVIAKNTRVKKIYSNELNKEANKYSEQNIKRNKLEDKVQLLPGDIRKVAKNLEKERKTYDLILMTRPNLDETFLHEAFILSHSGTRIYYHGFCRVEEKEKIIQEIILQAKRHGFRIKILNTKEIGELGPGKIRFRVYFKVYKRSFFRRIFRK